MKWVRGLAVVLMLLAMQSVFADDVKLTASSKPVVSVGERFQITFEVNADGRNFTSPDFGSLTVLSGPNTSTSSSIQIINGRTDISYTKTYSFIVQANAEGEVTVSPASVIVDGKKYTSNSLKIKVVKGSAPATTPQSSGNRSSGTTSRSSSGSGVLQKDDVYVKASVSNTNPYIGEQVIVTYTLYTRVPISNLMINKAPSFTGFWSKSLSDNNSQLKPRKQIINGQEYTVAEITRYALFPQKTGVLTVDPAELQCTAQIRISTPRKRSNDPFEDFFNDPFFNRNVRNVETTLRSKPIKIKVKPLPEKGKPENFSGAVGDFTFKSSIDRNKLKANEALTLSFTVIGKGNLELLDLPSPEFPSDFEVYDPKVTSNIKTRKSGISGSKKFEYLAIPRTPGDFVIKPVTFTFFNPSENKYYSYSSGEFKIHVEKGDKNASAVTYSSSAQEDIKFIGKDIRHIKSGPFDLEPANVFFFESNTFYILLALPVVLLILVIILWKRQEKRMSNVSLMKTRKANKVAKTRLHKAEKFRKEGKEKAFYDEIAQALWGYIADKFNIPQANLSIETVKETLTGKGADEKIVDNFVNTLNNIEFARFAPGEKSGKMDTVYKEALNAISQAEKGLK